MHSSFCRTLIRIGHNLLTKWSVASWLPLSSLVQSSIWSDESWSWIQTISLNDLYVIPCVYCLNTLSLNLSLTFLIILFACSSDISTSATKSITMSSLPTTDTSSCCDQSCETCHCAIHCANSYKFSVLLKHLKFGAILRCHHWFWY